MIPASERTAAQDAFTLALCPHGPQSLSADVRQLWEAIREAQGRYDAGQADEIVEQIIGSAHIIAHHLGNIRTHALAQTRAGDKA